MKPRASTLVWGLVALAAILWAWQWWQGDERRLRSRLGELADLIGKSEGENQLSAANQARQLGLFLAEPFEIRLEPFGQVVSDRQQLQQLFFAYRAGFTQIAADFAIERLEVDPATRLAAIEAIASLSGERTSGGPARDRYRLRLGWVETGGEWQLREVVLVEVLGGAAGLF